MSFRNEIHDTWRKCIDAHADQKRILWFLDVVNDARRVVRLDYSEIDIDLLGERRES